MQRIPSRRRVRSIAKSIECEPRARSTITDRGESLAGKTRLPSIQIVTKSVELNDSFTGPGDVTSSLALATASLGAPDRPSVLGHSESGRTPVTIV